MEENPVIVSEEEKEPEAQSEGKKPFNLKKELWEWAKAIVFAGVIVFLIFHFLIRVVSVDGSSMVHHLQPVLYPLLRGHRHPFGQHGA